MSDTIVALDLETTGLDPSHDHIIEIGLVRFEGSQILEEFQTLINPDVPIPSAISQLTGLEDRDLELAPDIATVLPAIRRFIGTAPILGHSVGFDLEFLASHGLYLHNPAMDSYALASTLLPTAPRYNLTALAAELGIEVRGAHRALNDVHTTIRVYQELLKLVDELRFDILSEIVRLGQSVAWGGELFFQAALHRRLNGRVAGMQSQYDAESESGLEDVFRSVEFTFEPSLIHRQDVGQVNIDEIAAMLEPDGILAHKLPGYEHREQQVAMLEAIGTALNEGRHILIEAPTGVGKSLAYLIPAAQFAVQNDCRVVVSTNTINLQEQLINKDIPVLREILDLPIRAAVLKGRSNYLCPRRLAAMRRRGPTSAEEMQILARLLVWTATRPDGDRGEITLRGNLEQAIWHRLSADDEGCTLNRCLSQMGGACPFYQARAKAESAHIVVVNHSLLLSDVVTEGRVLPDYRYLIIDEAHHLEEAITNGLSFQTDPHVIKRVIGELGSSDSGLLGEVLQQCQGTIPEGYFRTLDGFIQSVAEASQYMAQHIDLFFRSILLFVKNAIRMQASDYTQQIRLLPVHRQHASWGEVEKHWDNLGQFTSTIALAMTELEKGLQDLRGHDIDEYEDLLAGVGAAARHLDQLHQSLEQIVTKPDPNRVYWAEFQPDGERLSLHAAPLDVGPLVQQHLWNTKETIVLTSATLRTDSSFAYFRSRLDADHVEELVVDTPFDYENSTLLYLVNDIPEPDERIEYQQAVEDGLLALCRATQGRSLILFTSYAQLRQTARAITDPLARDGIVVYDQAVGASRSQLIEGFVESEKAVLMGTRSFWEGVDIPGVDLSVLVIVRLPFTVPTDPLFAARSELFDNAFMEYAVPEAILRFRQGFGRLIRRKDDRGVVTIFDRRVISKRYGQLFLDALPRCTTQRGKLKDLPGAAVRWLALDL